MKTMLYKKMLIASAVAVVANLAACDRTKETDYSSTTTPDSTNVEQQPTQTNTTENKIENKLASAEDKLHESATTLKSSTNEAVTTAGNAVADSVVTGRVKAALLADKDIKGTDIKVETAQGIVTLNGVVNSQAQMEKAESVARTIEGVKTIDNRLSVKG